MKRLLINVVVVVASVGMLGGNLTFSRAGDDEAKKKLDQIRKELDELTQKEKALAKERDDLIQKEKELAKKREDLQRSINAVQQEANRRAEELRQQKEIAQKKFDEADKKRHHAKIELRGKLISSKTLQPKYPLEMWFVLTNETLWPLQFDNKKKEIQEAVSKLSGQPVVVTGTISTLKKNTPMIYPFVPDVDPFNPYPRTPRAPQIRPYPQYALPMQEPMQLPVIVDSIRLFEEK